MAIANDDDECECSLRDDPRCILGIEEGQASLRHVACGKPLWLYTEDIFAEFPVTVAIETCDNPGGWHGLERCECGPEVSIELDREAIAMNEDMNEDESGEEIERETQDVARFLLFDADTRRGDIHEE